MTNSMRPSMAMEEIHEALTTAGIILNRMEDTSILFHEDEMMDDTSRLSNYDFSIQDAFDAEDPHARLKNFDNERRASICSLGASLRDNYVPRKFCCEEDTDDDDEDDEDVDEKKDQEKDNDHEQQENLPKSSQQQDLQVVSVRRRGKRGLLASTKSTAKSFASKSMRSLGMSKDNNNNNSKDGGELVDKDHHHHHHGSVWQSMKSLTTLHHNHHHHHDHHDGDHREKSHDNCFQTDEKEETTPWDADEGEQQDNDRQPDQQGEMEHSNKDSGESFNWDTKGTALEDDSDDDDDDVPSEEDNSKQEVGKNSPLVNEEDDDEDFPVPRMKNSGSRRGGLKRATSLKLMKRSLSPGPSSGATASSSNRSSKGVENTKIMITTPSVEEPSTTLTAQSPVPPPRRRMGGLKRAASQRIPKSLPLDPSTTTTTTTTQSNSSDLAPRAAGTTSEAASPVLPVQAPRKRMGGMRKAASFKLKKSSLSLVDDDPASGSLPNTNTSASPKPTNTNKVRRGMGARGLHQLKKAASFKISKNKTSSLDAAVPPALVATGDLGLSKSSTLVGSSPTKPFPPIA